nr:MAG TPA: hypothetical protein [Caudoviricetes sp.]DAT17466.1 MAG TPA: hypothetical protein [Caudoviricetes sp.]DAU00944.1 MAG TPA: hypothetical protein [Caudoviricetes sp.]DAX38647.1 MAG TPA: hypothetical protein [Caudoviricetes sp.]
MNESQKFLMESQKSSVDSHQSFLILIEWKAKV